MTKRGMVFDGAIPAPEPMPEPAREDVVWQQPEGAPTWLYAGPATRVYGYGPAWVESTLEIAAGDDSPVGQAAGEAIRRMQDDMIRALHANRPDLFARTDVS